MAKYIKNNSGVTDTWSGQELTNGQIYELSLEDDLRFIIDSREVGGKIETDVASGDLQVSLDNFAVTMSASDAIDVLRASNAGCIQEVYVDDSAKADGFLLGYDSASDKIIYKNVALQESDMAVVSLKRSTTLALPVTPTTVAFDIEEIENKPLVLEHDNTNTDRIYLHQSAYYFGALSFEILNGSSQDRTFTIELWVNGASILSSVSIVIDKSSSEHITRNLIIPPLTAGSYITIRMGADNNNVSLRANARVGVFQMKGATGAQGPAGATGATGAQGPQGPSGIIGIWTGPYNAGTAYSVNDQMEFSGSSYNCIVATSAGENPDTHPAKWDLVAQKGDTGESGIYGSQYHYAESETESQTTSTTLQTKTSITTSSLPAGDYEIDWQAEISNLSNGVLSEIEVKVGATVIALPTMESDNDFLQFSGFKKMTLSGVVTATIKYRVQTTGTAAIRKARLKIKRVN